MENWTSSPRELHGESASGRVHEILDVRHSEEFAAQKLEGRRDAWTRHASVHEVLEDPGRHAAATLDGAVVVCAHGNGSVMVVQEFSAAGNKTRSLGDGMDDVRSAKLEGDHVGQ